MRLPIVHVNRLPIQAVRCFQLPYRQHSSTTVSSKTRPSATRSSADDRLTKSSAPSKSTSGPSISRRKELRSIIELYHSAEHFAPVDDHDRLIEFIDDSLLFKKAPTPYAPPSSPHVLQATIRALPLNEPILRPGEAEFDLNPLVAPHRVRAGQRRWEMLKDALCGTAGSAPPSDPRYEIGVVGSGFRAPAQSNGSESLTKAGLEIVEENWEQIKEIDRQS